MLNTTSATFSSLVSSLLTLVYTAEWLCGIFAVAIFILGVIRFIAGTNVKDHKGGYTMMMWGLVALFIIFSIQGILFFLCSGLLGGTYCTS